MKDDLVETLKQPEYTGENRCGACTVVNLLIAGVLGALVARKSRLAGALTVGVSVALIYLRGYLVPGTPALTKRYLPPKVLALFGKEPPEPEMHSGFGAVDPADSNGGDSAADPADSETAATDSVAAANSSDADSSDADGEDEHDAETDRDDQADAIAPDEYFLEHGIVEPCEDVDDLCLTDAFESAWFDEIDAIDIERVDADDVLEVFEVDALESRAEQATDGTRADDANEHDYEIRRHNDARMLKRSDGAVIGKWPSQAALVADVTATRVLPDYDSAWETYPPETKGQLLNSLRLFLETCPTSRGPVVMEEEAGKSCCLSYDVVAIVCEETGERLFEHRIDGLEA